MFAPETQLQLALSGFFFSADVRQVSTAKTAPGPHTVLAGFPAFFRVTTVSSSYPGAWIRRPIG